MATYLHSITLTLIPSTSISPNTQISNQIHRTLRTLSTAPTTISLLYALSSTSPTTLKILLTSTSPTISPTTLFDPLLALLATPPTIQSLPPTTTLPRPSFPVDILTFAFASPPTPNLRQTFLHAADLLTTSISEASKPAGRDDNPCALHLCHFDDAKAYMWVSWKDWDAREKFVGSGAGRLNLRLFMAGEFEGCVWEEMGEGFWRPLEWLGGRVVEEEQFVLEEVSDEGWGEYVRGWVGWLRGLVGG